MINEIKRIITSKLLIATFIAVIILPLIYGGLYLWAFWDPYSKIKNIPVAIVNEDVCSYKNNEADTKRYCFGNELVDKLNEEKAMNWQFVNRKTAQAGLKNRNYYTMAIIPQDFSQNILSVDSDNPQKAIIEFSSRQASSFMASKFSATAFDKIKSALNEKIAKEYFDNIFSQMRDSVEDLDKAVDGSSELQDGLVEASDGSGDLYDGTDKLYDGINDLNNGLNDLKNGAQTLHDGFNVVQTGKTKSFSDGVNEALSGSEKLVTGSTTLNNGIKNLDTGLTQSVNGTQSLALGSKQVLDGLSGGVSQLDPSISALATASALLNSYLTQHPDESSSTELITIQAIINQVGFGLTQFKTSSSQLVAGQTQIYQGLSQLNTGLVTAKSGSTQLATGSAALVNGISQLSSGLVDIKNGKDKLNDGTGSLVDGLEKAKDGSQTLLSGAEELKNGQKDLFDGLLKAKDGVTELKNKLAEAVTKTIKKTDPTKNERQTNVMSAPVDIHDISIDIVVNNGTGFAPYFIPLALWVGSMGIFFLIELDFKKKPTIKQLLPKVILSLVVASLQAITLDEVLTRGLDLPVNNKLAFFMFTILLAWCYTWLQFYITLRLGIAGKFVGIILLMLQLTSSAGSYPLETSPKFFQKINPFLPMTYAVTSLKELISGSNFELVHQDVKIITLMSFVFIIFILLYVLKPNKILLHKAKTYAPKKK